MRPTTAPPPVPILPLEDDLRFRLSRAHRAVRGAWQAHLADLGLTSAQASVLRAVMEQPGLGLRELARRLGTDPMNAKRLADGLERDGLLVSAADPGDGRIRGLSATAEGTTTGGEVARRAAGWGAALETLLGSDDTARLRAILERLEAAAPELPTAATTVPAAKGAPTAGDD
jgi:DNA-binding MarR family transcriptional regulator